MMGYKEIPSLKFGKGTAKKHYSKHSFILETNWKGGFHIDIKKFIKTEFKMKVWH